MRPVPVFPDYLVKLVIPASRAITKPAVTCRCVPLPWISTMKITIALWRSFGAERFPQGSEKSKIEF